MYKNKKAISTVVATVLIILITVAAVTIIWSAVVPMIRENLEGGSACLDAVSQVAIVGTGGYTCVNNNNGSIKIQVQRGAKDFDFADVQVLVLQDSGDTNSTYLLGNSEFWNANSLPGQNEEKVFISDTKDDFKDADKISIAPAVGSGDTKVTCEISSSFDLVPCE